MIAISIIVNISGSLCFSFFFSFFWVWYFETQTLSLSIGYIDRQDWFVLTPSFTPVTLSVPGLERTLTFVPLKYYSSRITLAVPLFQHHSTSTTLPVPLFEHHSYHFFITFLNISCHYTIVKTLNTCNENDDNILFNLFAFNPWDNSTTTLLGHSQVPLETKLSVPLST